MKEPQIPDIQFVSETKGFNLKNSTRIKKWILLCSLKEKKKIGNLCFIFSDDQSLYQLNVKYLKHNTFTDIITFDYSETAGLISGDIFISIERVKENAIYYGTGFDMELQRVMVHGLLHLLGYKDKKAMEKKRMRQKEDFYLHLFKNQSKNKK